VDIQLGRLQKLLQAKRLTLDLTDSARELLAERGYDPTYGARPLKRAVQKYLLDPMALKVLNGEFAPGEHIQADAGPDGLTFAKVLVDNSKGVKKTA
jgi:ATP-dependent Clp protease ATP-binding subunit ClpB